MSVFAILPSGGELLVALLIGLLLFGGKLPEVAKDIGRTFFKLRRSVNDLRRETGIDETIRDLKREVEQAKPVVDLNTPPYQPWPGDRKEEEGADPEAAEPAESVAPTEPDMAGDDAPKDDGPVERTTSPNRQRAADLADAPGEAADPGSDDGDDSPASAG